MQEDELPVAEDQVPEGAGEATERTDEPPAAPPEPTRTVLGQLGPDEWG